MKQIELSALGEYDPASLVVSVGGRAYSVVEVSTGSSVILRRGDQNYLVATSFLDSVGATAGLMETTLTPGDERVQVVTRGMYYPSQIEWTGDQWYSCTERVTIPLETLTYLNEQVNTFFVIYPPDRFGEEYDRLGGAA